jgi:hypothetical protein
MSTRYPSNRISMRSGSVCNAIFLPCPDVADHQLTRCEPSSMRSSRVFAHRLPMALPPHELSPLANGVLPFSPLARSPAPGARLLTTRRVAEREQVGKNAQRSRAIMDATSASKPLRSPLGSAGSMRIPASKDASAICSSIRLVCSWQCTLRLPICTIREALDVCLPVSLQSSHASKNSGQM